MKQNQIYMVFDVESVGLHGEGFAVGWVVVDDLGIERSHGLISCDPIVACGITDKSEQAAREWLSKNIPPLRVTHESLREMRTDFWKQWLMWRGKGAVLVADCAWPVEARFLGLCVSDDADAREWEGPYPLHDLASILLAAGFDPLAKFVRKEDEFPEHNPLNDARQSARILISKLNLLKEATWPKK